MTKRNNICLAAITGNEEQNIVRFLESFSKAADSVILVQAIGNVEPDNTREIAVDWAVKNGMDLEFHTYFNKETLTEDNFPHVDNFGHARQEAWDLAAETGAKYLMWADLDDVLADGAAEALQEAAESEAFDVFVCPYHVRPNGEQVVMRERLVRNDGISKWRYPVHEQLKFSRDVSYRILKDAIFLHTPHEKKSGSHERNMRILTKATETAGRDFFYMQQEFVGRDPEKHRTYAMAALACPGLDAVEKYEVYLNLAQSENGPKAKEWAALAYATQPDRREALALLAEYAAIDQDWYTCYHFAKMMMLLPRPARSYWNLVEPWYGWRGLQTYAKALRGIGRKEEADKADADALALMPTA